MKYTFLHGLTLLAAFCLPISVTAVEDSESPEPEGAKLVRLVTATSTVSSGLMDVIKPAFEKDTGFQLSVGAFGTGRSLRVAREGLADALLVHSPPAELKFMARGYGKDRKFVMKNAFVIAGPSHDPADIAVESSVVDALMKIYKQRALFVSRADDSGTHKKEVVLWKAVDIDPFGDWYIEYGKGMGDTLNYAARKQAYVLVDKGTWLARHKELNLKVLFQNDGLLDNPYHLITVSPEKAATVNADGANEFMRWILSEKAQALIGSVRVNGEKLFTPATGK
ncbi:MAG: substrate-binding domain-containing protein [Cellvibrionaceae bacterium]